MRKGGGHHSRLNLAAFFSDRLLVFRSEPAKLLIQSHNSKRLKRDSIDLNCGFGQMLKAMVEKKKERKKFLLKLTTTEGYGGGGHRQGRADKQSSGGLSSRPSKAAMRALISLAVPPPPPLNPTVLTVPICLCGLLRKRSTNNSDTQRVISMSPSCKCDPQVL